MQNGLDTCYIVILFTYKRYNCDLFKAYSVDPVYHLEINNKDLN